MDYSKDCGNNHISIQFLCLNLSVTDMVLFIKSKNKLALMGSFHVADLHLGPPTLTNKDLI